MSTRKSCLNCCRTRSILFLSGRDKESFFRPFFGAGFFRWLLITKQETGARFVLCLPSLKYNIIKQHPTISPTYVIMLSTNLSAADIIESAMSAMTNESSPALFDVTIVCTTDDFQAAYWMERLSKGICKGGGGVYPMVLAVSEDWSSPSGAGNGLGTLYAFQKACRVAKEKYDVDLEVELMGGKVSAALYHTAGKGTRLAPLPASENNNKPGVVSHVLVLWMSDVCGGADSR